MSKSKTGKTSIAKKTENSKNKRLFKQRSRGRFLKKTSKNQREQEKYVKDFSAQQNKKANLAKKFGVSPKIFEKEESKEESGSSSGSSSASSSGSNSPVVSRSSSPASSRYSSLRSSRSSSPSGSSDSHMSDVEEERKTGLEQLSEKYGNLIDASKEEIRKAKVAKAKLEEDPSAGAVLGVIVQILKAEEPKSALVEFALGDLSQKVLRASNMGLKQFELYEQAHEASLKNRKDVDVPFINLAKCCGHMNQKQRAVLEAYGHLVHKFAPQAEAEAPMALLRTVGAVPDVADQIIKDLITSIAEDSKTLSLLKGLLKTRIACLRDEEARQRFIDLHFQKVHSLLEQHPNSTGLEQIQLSLLQADLKMAQQLVFLEIRNIGLELNKVIKQELNMDQGSFNQMRTSVIEKMVAKLKVWLDIVILSNDQSSTLSSLNQPVFSTLLKLLRPLCMQSLRQKQAWELAMTLIRMITRLMKSTGELTHDFHLVASYITYPLTQFHYFEDKAQSAREDKLMIIKSSLTALTNYLFASVWKSISFPELVIPIESTLRSFLAQSSNQKAKRLVEQYMESTLNRHKKFIVNKRISIKDKTLKGDNLSRLQAQMTSIIENSNPTEYNWPMLAQKDKMAKAAKSEEWTKEQKEANRKKLGKA